ncbi:MAG: AAA family ATPase [Clostridiales bacterium]|jgi:chromosome partitioning protein|nr:AAA family ATPase [Clostridiales bacterium]
MSKIVAFSNQKGGVGKTTTCVNLSAYLAAMGKRVLLLDIDPQGNASSGLGIQKKELQNTTYNVLIGECTAKEAIIKTSVQNLDILPSNIDLVGAELELINNVKKRDEVLKVALLPLDKDYDYINIDCPPSLGLLTVNSLAAADSIVIPLQGEYYALEGLSQLMNTIRLVKKHYNPKLEVEGVVLTMYDSRSNLSHSVTEEIVKYFGKKVFDTKIPRNVRLGEAPSFGLSIMQFDPKSTGGLAYMSLTEEFLLRNNDSFNKIKNPINLRKKD